MELKLIKNLHFNLNIRSPFDFLQEKIEYLVLPETEQILVETAIDFALSLV